MELRQIDFYVVLVLYNKLCSDSISYKQLRKIGNIKVIVCDNSTKRNNNKVIVQKDNNIYINMNGNKGLSKAYNKAIEAINDKNSYVCLLDDDTYVDETYFQNVYKYISATSAKVFLPIVVTKERILSPCELREDGFIHQIKNVKNINLKYISAINSGMVIKRQIFNNFKYDENLFLDYIDHYFMNYIRRKKIEICIMDDVKINQNFSMEDNTLESSYKRLCIMKKDLKYFYKDNKTKYWRQIIEYKLVMIKKYKSLKFIYLKTEEKQGE